MNADRTFKNVFPNNVEYWFSVAVSREGVADVSSSAESCSVPSPIISSTESQNPNYLLIM